jgi:hypothetical protein
LDQAGRSQAAEQFANLRTLLDRLIQQNKPPQDDELRHLRSLLISAAPATAEALQLLDAVLDSPLDVDSSVLKVVRSRLESRPSPCPSRTEDLASRFRATTRTLQQQAERIQQGRVAFDRERASQASVSERLSAEAAPRAKSPVPPVSPAKRSIRGLHVRQGGHDFVLPIEIVERALATDVSRLPTVHGRPVACVSGEMCDVVRLADELDLSICGNSSPGTLIVIARSGRRVCLAVDEVVGPVKATVTPLDRVLPDATAAVDVASLESGGLALVPDFSRFVC